MILAPYIPPDIVLSVDVVSNGCRPMFTTLATHLPCMEGGNHLASQRDMNNALPTVEERNPLVCCLGNRFCYPSVYYTISPWKTTEQVAMSNMTSNQFFEEKDN